MLDYLKYQKAREDSGVGDGGILKQFFPCKAVFSLLWKEQDPWNQSLTSGTPFDWPKTSPVSYEY